MIKEKALKFIAKKAKCKVEDLIWLEEQTKIGDYYYQGLINNNSLLKYVSKTYSKIFYECEDCHKLIKIKAEAIKVLREAEENQEKTCSKKNKLSKDTDSVLSVEELANLALSYAQ